MSEHPLGGSFSFGGLLGRWDGLKPRQSKKKIIPCHASTAEYVREGDFLKKEGVEKLSEKWNYASEYTRFECVFLTRFECRFVLPRSECVLFNSFRV